MREDKTGANEGEGKDELVLHYSDGKQIVHLEEMPL
jgi:hypothetical protein